MSEFVKTLLPMLKHGVKEIRIITVFGEIQIEGEELQNLLDAVGELKETLEE